jgi:hypothetical protein
VQYVFHLQVVVDDQPQSLGNVQYSAPTDPVEGSTSIASAMAAEAQLMGAEVQYPDGGAEAVAAYEEPVAQAPVRVEKTPGRNEPCFCGSGKKYKLCHGR